MEYNLVLEEVVEGNEKPETQRNFLDLTLGLGSASTKLQKHGSSPSLQLQHVHQLGSSVNLGLGYNHLPSSSRPILHAASSNSHDLLHLLGSISKNPQRSLAGIWFTLRSSINREGQVLPQIPKAYIRVKDDTVTVSMVKTYLVTKLGLYNEAEVEISCMGQNLLHSQTLKHVRDVVWLPQFIQLSNSKSNWINEQNHLMPLDYGIKTKL